MKHTALLILAAITCLLCSCAGLTAFFASNSGQAVVALADIGLDLAAKSGKIKTGDSIAIQKGVAIVTSPGSTVAKVFSLQALGLSQAVADGYVKPGDAILVQGISAVIQTAITPATAPKAPAAPVQ